MHPDHAEFRISVIVGLRRFPRATVAVSHWFWKPQSCHSEGLLLQVLKTRVVFSNDSLQPFRVVTGRNPSYS